IVSLVNYGKTPVHFRDISLIQSFSGGGAISRPFDSRTRGPLLPGIPSDFSISFALEADFEKFLNSTPDIRVEITSTQGTIYRSAPMNAADFKQSSRLETCSSEH
ncbi:MAG: hypothetical protein JWM04_872, partial [Verrucomicrobiales bacterium]|nr:hypothetical protein [Verrucomicrobiales bacterium]